MGFTHRNIPKPPTTPEPLQIPASNEPPQILIKKEISLVFKNGYKFTVSIEDKKLTMFATLEGKETFFLDEIPEEFKKSLREMLE